MKRRRKTEDARGVASGKKYCTLTNGVEGSLAVKYLVQDRNEKIFTDLLCLSLENTKKAMIVKERVNIIN